jgi:plastocyanin
LDIENEIAMKKLLFMTLLAGIAFQSLATNHVVYVNTDKFLPDTLRNIRGGDVITWIWQSGLQTTSSYNLPPNAPQWNSEISVGNSQFSYTVPEIAGVYNYRSNYNPTGVVGVFIVEGPTKINTASSTPTVSCSPNPASGKLHLDIRECIGQYSDIHMRYYRPGTTKQPV